MPDEIPDKERDWGILWALTEQINILDMYDARLLHEIRRRRPPLESTQRFFRAYQLLRGTQGKQLGKHAEAFRDICERRFRHSPKSKIKDEWHEAATEFRRQARSNHYSAFLKMYWFYHPDWMGMYDSRARDGLVVAERCFLSRERRRPDQRDFLERFEDVFGALQKHITRVSERHYRRYPFPRRILDKYLWLLAKRRKKDKDEGNKNYEDTLEGFDIKAGLRIAPIKSRHS